MKVIFDEGFFPFIVPEKDGSFASSVGPGTAYPVGFSLSQAAQIYWQAKNYGLTATGTGSYEYETQTLSATGNVPPRNSLVRGPYLYSTLSEFTPSRGSDLVIPCGTNQIVPGSGTITYNNGTEEGTNTALLNLNVRIFYPQDIALSPMVHYAGQWWPALSISSAIDNYVSLGGDEPILPFSCTTVASADTPTTIGSFSFFGTAVPVYCEALRPGYETFYPAETRSFSGSLTVVEAWP